MKSLLIAKHWQLFLTVVVPIFFLEAISHSYYGVNNLFIFKILRFILSFGIEASWMWVLCSHLIIKQESSLKIASFKFSLLLVVFYVPLQLILIEYFPEFRLWVLLPNTIVFLAFLYSIAFCAKLLRTIELGQEAGIGEYLIDFFRILFFPFGIWFLQKRVNSFA